MSDRRRERSRQPLPALTVVAGPAQVAHDLRVRQEVPGAILQVPPDGSGRRIGHSRAPDESADAGGVRTQRADFAGEGNPEPLESEEQLLVTLGVLEGDVPRRAKLIPEMKPGLVGQGHSMRDLVSERQSER